MIIGSTFVSRIESCAKTRLFEYSLNIYRLYLEHVKAMEYSSKFTMQWEDTSHLPRSPFECSNLYAYILKPCGVALSVYKAHFASASEPRSQCGIVQISQSGIEFGDCGSGYVVDSVEGETTLTRLEFILLHFIVEIYCSSILVRCVFFLCCFIDCSQRMLDKVELRITFGIASGSMTPRVEAYIVMFE